MLEVKDLNVSGSVKVTGSAENVGGVVGTNYGILENCSFEGIVTGNTNVGGIVGENRADGYAVYKIRENAFHGGTKLSAADGFLQYVMERLLSSSAPEQEDEDEELDESGDSMKLTSIQSISDFLNCAGRTMPDNIRLWARRNLAVARSSEVSAEERRHAQRALSIMTNIQWKNNYFEAIDPVEARRILDEELYGMEKVKQRIMETIIQICLLYTSPSPRDA